MAGSACHKNEMPQLNDSLAVSRPSVSSKTWLALGDSYTIGESVTASARYPAQTTAILKAAGIDIADPQYIATTGWTTANLIAALTTQNPRGPFSLVTLLIGVNDQYQGVDTATYSHNFSQLLQKAISLAGYQATHVVVLSIPDYGVTPFGSADSANIRRQIDMFNVINLAITRSYQVSYVDVTPVSRLAAGDPSFIAGDGLHPSAKQYAVWTSLLLPVAQQALTH